MKIKKTVRHPLEASSLERELGVIMCINLKWADHIQSAVFKANRAIGIIRNSFKRLYLISLLSREKNYTVATCKNAILHDKSCNYG